MRYYSYCNVCGNKLDVTDEGVECCSTFYPRHKVTCMLCNQEYDRDDKHICPCLSYDKNGDIIPQDDKNPMSYSIATSHEFSTYKIQPATFVHANNIPYLEGSVLYYILRHRDKGGKVDLEKAIHTIQMLIELEYNKIKE